MIFRPRRRFVRMALIGAATLALATGSALAATPVRHARKAAPKPASAASTPAPTTATAPAAVAPPIVYGLMAFLDPETGLLTGPISSLVPPADQRAASASVLLEPVPLPNGGWMLDLKGTGMESYVLHIDTFGRRSVTCVQGVADAPASTATPRKER